jgi:3-hydroxyacyl-CoA dehydrogenase
VVGNQGPHFSAGADAREILAAAHSGDWDRVTAVVAQFQAALMGLRHGPLPVVVAPHGMTLGGGCETALAAAALSPHAELYMGLVEAGIGLVPAGGGLKEIVRRSSEWAAQVPDGDPYPFLRRGFEIASTARVSTSAHDARNMGLLRPTDRITFHKSRVIADAKKIAVGLAEAGWTPPDRNQPITVVGAPHGASFFMGAWIFAQGGYASDHDKLVGEKVAHVLSGGMVPARTTVTADRLLELEREAFVSLCGEEKTRARIEHTLKTGKPLRN